ncbi:MAG: hypothetical protein ACR2J3_02365 [Aridibacter sp.]
MKKKKDDIYYDEFMPLPFEERLKNFNEISAENRALIVRTQVERWLAKNRSQLDKPQIAMLDETINFITPEKYEFGQDQEKVEQEAAKFEKKVADVFSRDEMMQIMTMRADYIPPVDAE